MKDANITSNNKPNEFVKYVKGNIINPLINSSVIQSEQALSNTLKTFDVNLKQIKNLPQNKAKFLSSGWFCQNLASGLGMILPYAVLGKITNIGLSQVGETLASKGLDAKILQSEVVANSVAAFGYGYEQNVAPNQSHLANALSNGLSFAVYGLGDNLISGKSFVSKLPGLAMIGAGGSVVGLSVQTAVDNHALPTFSQITKAAVTGAALNIALPTAMDSIAKLHYRINDKLQNGNYVGKYLKHNFSDQNISVFPEILELSKKFSWTKVVKLKNLDEESQAFDNTIFLAKTHKDLPALYHELKHIEQLKNLDLSIVQSHIQSGQIDKAYNEFSNLYFKNEAQAHIDELIMENRLNHAIKIPSLDEMIAQLQEDPKYLDKVNQEFANFHKRGLKPNFFKIDSFKYQDFIAHDWQDFETSQKIKLIENLDLNPNNMGINVLVNALNENQNGQVSRYALKYFDKLSLNDKTNIFQALIKSDKIESKVAAAKLISHLPKSDRFDSFKQFLKSASNLPRIDNIDTKGGNYWKKLSLTKRLHEELIKSVESLNNADKIKAFDLAFQNNELIPDLANQIGLLPENQRIKYFDKISHYLDSKFYAYSNYIQIENGLLNSISSLNSADRFEVLNSLIPKLKKFNVTQLTDAFLHLDNTEKIQIWNQVFDKVQNNKTDTESIEFLAKNISNLAQSSQIEAFDKVKSIAPNPNYLMPALDILPRNQQLQFLNDTIISNPKEELNYYSYFKNIPFIELPQLIDKIVTFDKSGFEVQNQQLTAGVIRSISHIENLHTYENENALKNIIETIGQHSKDSATFKRLFELYKEIHEPYDENNPNYAPVSQYIANNTNTQILGKILFYENPEIGAKIAYQYPKFIKKTLSKPLYTFAEDDHALNMAAESFFREGNIVSAIKTSFDSFKTDNLDYPKNETIALHVARLFKYLSKSLSNAQKEDAIKYLSSVVLSPKDTSFSFNKSNDTINTELAIMIAKEIGVGNPKLLNKFFIEPLNKYLASDKESFQQKYNIASIIALLIRHEKLQPDFVQIPEFNIISEFKLSKDEQIANRHKVELALHGDIPLSDIVGDEGILGQLYPHVFGNFETFGGFIGRPQHGFHEFELGLHSQKVLENVRQHKLYDRLSNDDKTNLLYAAYFHDIGKEAGIIDPDHDLKSARYLKAALSELGYSTVRIQRIFKMMQNHALISYEPHVKTFDKLQNDENFNDLMTYNFRSRISQIQARILNESDIRAINSQSSYYTAEVNAELDNIDKYLKKQSLKLNQNFIPVLTSKIPNRLAFQEVQSNFNLLVHHSPHMNTSFLDQISLIESPKSSLSTSFITPESNRLYNVDLSPSLVAIFESAPENISQASYKNEGTGRNTSETEHIHLIKDWNQSDSGKMILGKINRLLSAKNVKSDYNSLVQQYLQYDSLDSLLAKEPDNSPLRILNHSINHALTTDEESEPISSHNEIKISSPVLVGFGLLRRGQTIHFDSLTPQEFKTLFLSDVIPSYVQFSKPLIKAKFNESEPITISHKLLQFAKSRQIPFLVLDK